MCSLCLKILLDIVNVVFNVECLKFLLSAPVQDIKNRIVGGPIPTLTVTNSRIKGNKQGVRASFYNRLVYIYKECKRQSSNTVHSGQQHLRSLYSAQKLIWKC